MLVGVCNIINFVHIVWHCVLYVYISHKLMEAGIDISIKNNYKKLKEK